MLTSHHQGKYVYQYRDSQSQVETTPRNDEDLSPSRLAPMVSSSTTGSSQYYGNREYDFQNSSQTSAPVDQLSDNFTQTSLSDVNGPSQYPSNNASPCIVTSMSSGPNSEYLGIKNWKCVDKYVPRFSSHRTNCNTRELLAIQSHSQWIHSFEQWRKLGKHLWRLHTGREYEYWHCFIFLAIADIGRLFVPAAKWVLWTSSTARWRWVLSWTIFCEQFFGDSCSSGLAQSSRTKFYEHIS